MNEPPLDPPPPPGPRDLAAWRALCEHLEGRRRKSEYPTTRWVDDEHRSVRTFVSAPPERHLAFAALIGSGKEAVAARREYELIWWCPGEGWKLRRGWQERLAELGEAQ